MWDMAKESLELLEHELAAAMVCSAEGCGQPAVAVAVYRTVCAAGGRTRPTEADFLSCTTHVHALTLSRIELNTWCSGCGRNVGGQPFSHIIARVVPLVPSC